MKYLIGFLMLMPILMGANYSTTNFTVTAINPQVAQQVGQQAETSRKELASLWLGKTLPNWSRPCPINVTVTDSLGGGATSFAFDRGNLYGIDMRVEGRLDKLLSSVVPHEVCHTIFATVMRQPTPRWCDEGAAVTCEDLEELKRQDQLCRQILNTPGRAMPLTRLFSLKEYPKDVMILYAQGYSVTRFLILKKGRSEFLWFVGLGMRNGWDEAVSTTYGYRDVNALEADWLKSLKESKGQPVTAIDAPRIGGNSFTLPTPAVPVQSSQGDLAKVLQTLADTQRIQAGQIQSILEDNKKLHQRLDQLERRQGSHQDSPHPNLGSLSSGGNGIASAVAPISPVAGLSQSNPSGSLNGWDRPPLKTASLELRINSQPPPTKNSIGGGFSYPGRNLANPSGSPSFGEPLCLPGGT